MPGVKWSAKYTASRSNGCSFKHWSESKNKNVSCRISMTSGETFGSWEDAVVWLRSQPDRQQLVLDAFYDDPLIAAASRYYASSEWRSVSALLEGRTGRALDVGAGRGIASYALARE